MDTAVFPTTAPVEVWLDHPVVKRVVRALPEGATPEALLSSLYETLTELDDRFPGMKLSEVLSRPTDPASVDEVRSRLKKLGVKSHDIDIVAPKPNGGGKPSEVETDLQLARSGLSAVELVKKYGIALFRAKRITWLRNPVTELDRKVAERINAGEPQAEVGISLGISPNTVRWAMLRWRFHNPA